MSGNDTRYGLGENPPYSLYQSDNGMWGLIDGSGIKLEAVFKRGEKDCFSRVPWEIVTFNEQEGFELLAWYDPCDVWFNFTWEDSAYPDEFTGLLWKRSDHEIGHYRDALYQLMPIQNHWLIDDILKVDDLDRMDDDKFYWHIDALLSSKPELSEASITNPMLDPIMRDSRIDKDIKIAIWRAKVRLDSHIKVYKEDYPEGM